MQKNSKIYVAGHKGLVGSAILKNLYDKGYSNIIFKTHAELDLTDSRQVAFFFETEKPEYVFLAAAKVGGIVANNTYRADFIFENLSIQNNIIHYSYLNQVKKLLFLGSTCIYPKNAPQPIKEEYLLTDTLEYTNEPYAIAKIAGIKMCESYNIQYNTNFISVMPTNLYGPNDNFNFKNSHVLPALLRKVHLGKALENEDWTMIEKDFKTYPYHNEIDLNDRNSILKTLNEIGIHKNDKGTIEISIWGTGKPLREFLWSEDMADACVYIMENVDFQQIVQQQWEENLELKNNHEIRNTHINIGTGEDISIANLANLIKQIVGFQGEFYFDHTKPDGTYKKLTNPTKLKNLGWHYQVNISHGISNLYKWYLNKLNG